MRGRHPATRRVRSSRSTRLHVGKLLRPKRQPYGSVLEAEHELTSLFVVSQRRTAQGTAEVSSVSQTNHSLNDLREGFAATANRGPLPRQRCWPARGPPKLTRQSGAIYVQLSISKRADSAVLYVFVRDDEAKISRATSTRNLPVPVSVLAPIPAKRDGDSDRRRTLDARTYLCSISTMFRAGPTWPSNFALTSRSPATLSSPSSRRAGKTPLSPVHPCDRCLAALPLLDWRRTHPPIREP